MPKGCYDRDGAYSRAEWSVEQDEWLKAQCLTSKSYGAIVLAFNEAFPNNRKTRSAIMGRASRRGYADHKPHVPQHYGSKPRKKSNPQPSARMIKLKRNSEPRMVPVVFGEGTQIEFREEGRRLARTQHQRKSATEIEAARRGFLPSIVENAPLTSVLWSECPDNGCRWPTSETPFMVCGSPAKVGSYCARHGDVAFREMPTLKRNRGYAKRGMLETRTKTRMLSAEAQAIADSLLDDEVVSPGIATEGDILMALLRKTDT